VAASSSLPVVPPDLAAELQNLPVPQSSYAVAVVHPLSELTRFVDERRRRFKDFPRGATPPWFWSGEGAARGAIVRDPAAFYRAVLKASSR